MSMSTTTDTGSRYDCAHDDCQKTFLPEHAIAGSFCSVDCWNRDKGRKLLNNLQYDHCYCSNCGTKLKEVEKPPKSFLVGKDRHSANSIVGFQYRTPSADTGEIDVDDTPGREVVATGTVCGECGNANQSEAFPEDRERHLFEYAQRILESLAEKREQGVPVKPVDEQEFFDALVETEDLVLGLGRAIE
jgi:hypothetical protein